MRVNPSTALAHKHDLWRWGTAIGRVAMRLGHPQLLQSAAAVQNMAGQLGTSEAPTLGTQAPQTLGTAAPPQPIRPRGL